MLLITFTCISLWFFLRKRQRSLKFLVVIFAVLVTGLVIFASSNIIIAHLYLGENQWMDVYTPLNFPFTMVRKYDLNDDVFFFQIIFGYLEGSPLVIFGLMENQSEFIQLQRIQCGTILSYFAIFSLIIQIPVMLTLETLIKYSIRRC